MTNKRVDLSTVPTVRLESELYKRKTDPNSIDCPFSLHISLQEDIPADIVKEIKEALDFKILAKGVIEDILLKHFETGRLSWAGKSREMPYKILGGI